MATSKTVAERQRDFKKSKHKQGLREVHNLWARPEDHKEIKAFAASVLQRKQDIPQLTFDDELWEPVKNWLLVGGEKPEWVRRDNGIFLAFDSMTASVSDGVITYCFYYKGRKFFTKQTSVTGHDFWEMKFDGVQWARFGIEA